MFWPGPATSNVSPVKVHLHKLVVYVQWTTLTLGAISLAQNTVPGVVWCVSKQDMPLALQTDIHFLSEEQKYYTYRIPIIKYKNW